MYEPVGESVGEYRKTVPLGAEGVEAVVWLWRAEDLLAERGRTGLEVSVREDVAHACGATIEAEAVEHVLDFVGACGGLEADVLAVAHAVFGSTSAPSLIRAEDLPGSCLGDAFLLRCVPTDAPPNLARRIEAEVVGR